MSLAKPFETAAPNLMSPFGADILTLPLLNRFNKHHPALNSLPLTTFPLNQLVALQQLNSMPLIDAFNKSNKPKKTSALDAKKSGASSSFDAKSNALQKNFHPMRSSSGSAAAAAATTVAAAAAAMAVADSSELVKHQNVQTLLNSCRIPPSLSITLTNDDTEAISRSVFNTKNSNVVNSIEIVKLPDESSNESCSKFPSPSSSSEKTWQPNKNANNQMKLLAAAQQNNQIDSVSSMSPSSLLSESYQAKFLQSLLEKGDKIESLKSLKKPKPQQQQQQQQHQQKQPNRPTLNMIDELNRNQDAQKRKLQPADDKSAAKVRKLQQSSVPQQKSSPTTQRPVPDLLVPKDDKLIPSPSSSTSGGGGGGQASSTKTIENNKTSHTERASSTAASNSNASKVQQASNESMPSSKYMPLQTSSMPIWATHCTADQMASHRALAENLAQSKKNSGAYVD